MDNSPLAGVEIGLAKPRSSPGEEPEFVGSLTATHDNGEFRFYINRPPGRYELLALTQRGPVSLQDGQLIDFNPQQPVTDLTFHLAPLKKGRWRSFGAPKGFKPTGVVPLPEEADVVGAHQRLHGSMARGIHPWSAPTSFRDTTVYDLDRPARRPSGCTGRGMARFAANGFWFMSPDGLPATYSAITAAWDSVGECGLDRAVCFVW